MTYAALLSLAILRDDFSKLDRPGIVTFLRSCQRHDGRWLYSMIITRHTLNCLLSFSTVPGSIESDSRTLYCAFAISSMLNDWSGVDIDRAVGFLETCRVNSRLFGRLSPFIKITSSRLMKVVTANLPSVRHKVRQKVSGQYIHLFTTKQEEQRTLPSPPLH